MYKILIIEDDEQILKALKDHLETWSYEVHTISDFKKVDEETGDINPHLILMDITLPAFNGFYWTDKIRKFSSIPIVFISSADDNMNIVMAISQGADDFISKPFDINVLLAKLQAILRRSYELTDRRDIYEYKGVSFDIGRSVLSYRGKDLELTKNEGKIFKILLENKDKIVTRDDLIDYLWETDSFIDDNTLNVNINRFRKKLEDIGLKDLIKTKRGQGYIMEKREED